MKKKKIKPLEKEMTKKEIANIIMILNSSDSIFKFPIGNKELTELARKLENEKLISFNYSENKWSMN